MITEALDDFYRLILWDFYILKLKKILHKTVLSF